jgi:hypothetical protein
MSMPANDEEVDERLHSLETAQAVQVATQTGAQAAAHAGTWSTMSAGGAGLVAGIFLGLAIAKS